MSQLKRDWIPCAAAVAAAAVILLIIQLCTKNGFWTSNPYNSYILQAQSWLEGRLDLGMDYPYLELAIKNGKYYVSFPPFPSYLMLPFVALGYDNCDGLIAFVSSLAGVFFAFRTAKHFIHKDSVAVMLALLVTVGSNWLFTATSAWVWFIAQNLAFTFSIAAVYFALNGKPTPCLALWACAVGCRPFQAIWIVLLAYLLYTNMPHDTVISLLKKHWTAFIAPCLIAASYMVLNYARFGSITEFGHNYLPEFTRTQTGQFNIVYFKENFRNLWRLPFENGKINFFTADGFCIFVASPFYISYIVYTMRGLIKSRSKAMLLVIFALFWIHLTAISMHKTMGGSHIGNRYTNDILPFACVAVVSMADENRRAVWLNALPLAVGFALNVLWNICYFTNNIPWG